MSRSTERIKIVEQYVIAFIKNRTALSVVGTVIILGIAAGLWFLIQPQLLDRFIRFGPSAFIGSSSNSASQDLSLTPDGEFNSFSFSVNSSNPSRSRSSNNVSSDSSSTISSSVVSLNSSSTTASESSNELNIRAEIIPSGEDGSGYTCPYARFWQANIYTNQATNIRFYFARSDGYSSPEQAFPIDTATAVNTVFSWNSNNGNGWIELRITSPYQQTIRSSADNNCSTPVAQEPIYSFAAVGDIACSSGDITTNTDPSRCNSNRVAQLLTTLNPQKILLLGDIQYDNGDYSDFISVFDMQFSHLKNRILPSPGNHEYNTNGAAGYHQYFNSSLFNLGYYAQRLGNWNLISLDSNCDKVDCGVNGAQYQFLQSQLQNNVCTVTFWHHPPYSSGTQHGNTAWYNDLWNLQVNKQVVLNLSGHEHNYERFSLVGSTTPIVVGTGGKSLYNFGPTQPGSVYKQSDSLGVLFVQLQGKSLRYEFRNVDNETTDVGTLSCPF